MAKDAALASLAGLPGDAPRRLRILDGRRRLGRLGMGQLSDPRTIVWWSTGAASAVTARLILRENPAAIIARCETANEDPDNYRFEADVMRRLDRSVTLLKSEMYASVWDVWQGERYMAGIDGAPCTREMKIKPRLAFQRPADIHVFGYTADRKDLNRFDQLKANYPEIMACAPLIDRGITKAATLAMVQRWGIELPRSYAMGFPNANCLGTGCVKATSPDYWALFRFWFPEKFARTAAYAREIGARLTRINGVRIFIDEIPADWPTTNPIVPACDFLCHLAEVSI
jgi:hypothetical protein